MVGQKKSLQIQFPENFNQDIALRKVEENDDGCCDEAFSHDQETGQDQGSETTLKHPREESESPAYSDSDLSLSSATKKVSVKEGLKALLSKMLREKLKKKAKNTPSSNSYVDFEPLTEKKNKQEHQDIYPLNNCSVKIDNDYPAVDSFYNFQESYQKPVAKFFYNEPAQTEFAKYESPFNRDEFLFSNRENEMVVPQNCYNHFNVPAYSNDSMDVSHFFNPYVRSEY